MRELGKRLGVVQPLHRQEFERFTLSSSASAHFMLVFNPTNAGPQAQVLARELLNLCPELNLEMMREGQTLH
eukprot:COSAG01_NODE_63434_length_280_cov_0.569061_1_plen_71_part_10